MKITNLFFLILKKKIFKIEFSILGDFLELVNKKAHSISPDTVKYGIHANILKIESFPVTTNNSHNLKRLIFITRLF